MPDALEELRRGRESYARGTWMGAYESLSQADGAAPLGAEDLELLATSAFMLGRDDEFLSALERAHHAYLDAGEALRAVRCAFWVGMNLALRGEMGRASGWLGRARRLVEREGRECVERGYLLVPVMLRHEAAGDWEAAYATAADAADIGERFGDRDLLALAVHEQGCALIQQGRVEEGLGLLDEAMVAVISGELSPIVTGIVYCSVIMGCQEVYALHRAQEWTAALTRWCQEQPDMVAFSGRCLVHRAEIMELHGAWRDALEEARRAHKRSEQGKNQSAAAQAFYRQGEVYRLQGEFAAAEEAYREASRRGCEPQPGLALLRLARGHDDAAAAAIRRVVGETTEPLKRARLLPACVEIMLAVGDTREARSACRELEEVSARYKSGKRATRAACWVRWWRTPRGRSTWPKVTRGLPCSRCVARGRCGRNSRYRTRSLACACSWGWPAAPSATTNRPLWSWKRPGASSASWGQRRTSPASTRSPGTPPPSMLMG
jgi:tetratricopeptide (TPR) repeat protein